MQYSPNDDYLRIELDEGSVLLIAASWEGCRIMEDLSSTVPSRRGLDVMLFVVGDHVSPAGQS